VKEPSARYSFSAALCKPDSARICTPDSCFSEPFEQLIHAGIAMEVGLCTE
jgi:hypothetical protein